MLHFYTEPFIDTDEHAMARIITFILAQPPAIRRHGILLSRYNRYEPPHILAEHGLVLRTRREGEFVRCAEDTKLIARRAKTVVEKNKAVVDDGLVPLPALRAIASRLNTQINEHITQPLYCYGAPYTEPGGGGGWGRRAVTIEDCRSELFDYMLHCYKALALLKLTPPRNADYYDALDAIATFIPGILTHQTESLGTTLARELRATRRATLKAARDAAKESTHV